MKYTMLGALLLGALLFGGCGQEKPADGKLPVTASFAAVAEIGREIGGDRVQVTTLIPEGAEPHDFELKPSSVKAIAGSRVFLYSGLGMEPWKDQALQSAGNGSLIAAETSAGIEPIYLEEEHGHDHEPGHDHGGEAVDPHVWLTPSGGIRMAENIAAAYTEADPDGRDYYEARKENFIRRLRALDEEYREKFEQAPKKTIVAGHDAFGYLCRDYGLRQESVQDVYAEGEPGAGDLARLADFCRENGVTTVFAEELASPRVSETLASEAGARVETIDTLEGKADGSYEERIAANLEKIRKSLE